MPQSDLDELTGRTTDGVSRGARYLAAFDAIAVSVARGGDRRDEKASWELMSGLWREMTHQERVEVFDAAGDKLMAVGGAYFATLYFPDGAGPRETQATISRWAEETFGPAGSNARAISRANREMAELLEHVTSDDRHPEAAEEIADIVIVLSRVMTRLGVDLQTEIDRKMAKNRARKWRLDGTGHGYHVKEEGGAPNPCCGNVGTRGEGRREYCSTCGADLGERTLP